MGRATSGWWCRAGTGMVCVGRVRRVSVVFGGGAPRLHERCTRATPAAPRRIVASPGPLPRRDRPPRQLQLAPGLRHQRTLGIGEDQVLQVRDRARGIAGPPQESRPVELRLRRLGRVGGSVDERPPQPDGGRRVTRRERQPRRQEQEEGGGIRDLARRRLEAPRGGRGVAPRQREERLAHRRRELRSGAREQRHRRHHVARPLVRSPEPAARHLQVALVQGEPALHALVLLRPAATGRQRGPCARQVAGANPGPRQRPLRLADALRAERPRALAHHGLDLRRPPHRRQRPHLQQRRAPRLGAVASQRAARQERQRGGRLAPVQCRRRRLEHQRAHSRPARRRRRIGIARGQPGLVRLGLRGEVDPGLDRRIGGRQLRERGPPLARRAPPRLQRGQDAPRRKGGRIGPKDRAYAVAQRVGRSAEREDRRLLHVRHRLARLAPAARRRHPQPQRRLHLCEFRGQVARTTQHPHGAAENRVRCRRAPDLEHQARILAERRRVPRHGRRPSREGLLGLAVAAQPHQGAQLHRPQHGIAGTHRQQRVDQREQRLPAADHRVAALQPQHHPYRVVATERLPVERDRLAALAVGLQVQRAHQRRRCPRPGLLRRQRRRTARHHPRHEGQAAHRAPTAAPTPLPSVLTASH